MYIDNLRIFLTSWVILHHLAITYGAPGGWYYQEMKASELETIPLSMFVAVNQAFFMGMFFMISAYFMVPSLLKKGKAVFLKDRLLRLGIPTVIFFFFLHPLTVFIRNKFIYSEDVTLYNYIFESRVWGAGPMWFVMALIAFSLVASIFKFSGDKSPKPLPSAFKVILMAMVIAIAQFLFRIWLPVGWSMPITNWQLPHFGQYIVFFLVGLVAYRNDWFDQLTPKLGWRWFWSTQVIIFIGFPVIFISGGAMEGNIDVFMGGLTWQSLAYTLWEQFVGIGMVIALSGIFKERFNSQGNFTKQLSASAYAVYVFHTPILVLIGLLFLSLELGSIAKFVALAPITLILCFGLGLVIKRMPFVKSVF
ncbi:MAG: acyltransferase family protein [Cyclobacteriaceae bacterium]